MNSLKYIIAASAALALCACAAKEEKEEETRDESYYAASASISSDSPDFSPTESGGTVLFPSAGGAVTVNVSCGTEWTVVNNATDVVGTSVTGSAVVITVGENVYSTSRSGTVALVTSPSQVRFATVEVVQEAYSAPSLSAGDLSVRFPAVGDLTAEIEIESSLETWEVAEASDWLVAEKSGTGLLLRASENSAAQEREGNVTLSASDGRRTASLTIAVTQDARADIVADNDCFAFYGAGESAGAAVTSNYGWTYTCDGGDGWLDISRSGDVLTFTTSSDYDGDFREAALTLTCGDGAENVSQISLAVREYGPMPDALVLDYSVPTAGAEVTLPLYGSVDCTVVWGDGLFDTVTSARPTHVYAEAGSYTVSALGIVSGLNSYSDDFPSGSAAMLDEVVQWGSTGLTSMQFAFYSCTSLSSVPGDPDGILSDVITFSNAFGHCESLKTIPADIFSSCGKCTSFNRLFWSAGLTEIPSGLFDGCPLATIFSCVFYDCDGLTTVPSGLFDKCPEATDFSDAFQVCDNLVTIPDGLFDNNTKATTFYGIFYGCPALKSIPDGLFDNCPEVTSYRHAFAQCTSLTEVPDGLFAHSPLVTTFYGAFDGDSGLTAIPADLFDGCAEATDYTYAFRNCTGIGEIPAGLFASSSKATTFYGTFSGCSSLRTISADLFKNCAAAQDFRYLCDGCTLLQNVPDGLFDDCVEMTNVQYAFNECTSLTVMPEKLFDNNRKLTQIASLFYDASEITGESPYTVITVDGEEVKVHLYERENYPDYFSAISVGIYSFYNCKQLTDYSSFPSSWRSAHMR